MQSGKVLILNAADTKKAVSDYYARVYKKMSAEKLSAEIQDNLLIRLDQKTEKGLAELFLDPAIIEQFDAGEEWDALILVYKEWNDSAYENRNVVYIPERMQNK
jgi:hypothetical protein